jgi:septal ring-binding cell division protein DamX
MSRKGKCRVIVSNCSMNDYVLVYMRAEHKPWYLVAFGRYPVIELLVRLLA